MSNLLKCYGRHPLLLEAAQATSQRKMKKSSSTTKDCNGGAEEDLLEAFQSLSVTSENAAEDLCGEAEWENLKANANVFDIIGRQDVDINELMQVGEFIRQKIIRGNTYMGS
jgi:hypothetical protein